MESLGPYNVLQSIISKCCADDYDGWMHRRCIMDYAVSAGYYLKCISCLNTTFREDVKSLGVYVPDRDATWERVKGAYSELLDKNIFCDVKNCFCPKSRKFSDNGKWKLFKCQLCAATGTHKACTELTTDRYECFQCRTIMYNRNILDSIEFDANDDIKCVDISLRQERMASITCKEEIPCLDLVSEGSDYSITDIWNEMDAELERGPVAPIEMPRPIQPAYKYPPQVFLTQEQKQEVSDKFRIAIGLAPKPISEF